MVKKRASKVFNLNFNNKIINENYSKISNHVINLPVVVFTVNSRGGSGFFHSLIEDHNEILNIPQLSGIWDFSNDNKDKSIDLIAERFISRHPQIFNSSLYGIERWDSLGEDGNQFVTVDKNTFKIHLRELFEDIPINEKNIFYLIHAAYSITCNKDPFKAKILFYHMHTPEEYPFTYLPRNINFKILHITRDPRIGLFRYQESVKNKVNPWNIYGSTLIGKNMYLNPSKIYIDFVNIISQVQCFKNSFKEVSLITLEDLHEKRDILLNKVLHNYGISIIKKKLKSTFWGLQWHADARSEVRILGFQKNMRNKKFTTKLNRIDIFLIEFLTYHRSNSQGHKTINKFSNYTYWIILPIVFLISIIPISYELRSIKNNLINRNYKNLLLNLLYYSLRLFFCWRWLLKIIFKKIYYPNQIK